MAGGRRGSKWQVARGSCSHRDQANPRPYVRKDLDHGHEGKTLVKSSDERTHTKCVCTIAKQETQAPLHTLWQDTKTPQKWQNELDLNALDLTEDSGC